MYTKNPSASFVVDVGVIEKNSANGLSTNNSVENKNLLTFGEAKHMTAFAELISGFIGLVHELKHVNLRKSKAKSNHLDPFLYVSGFVNPSAEGVISSVEKRGYRIKFYDRNTRQLENISIEPMPTIPRK